MIRGGNYTDPNTASVLLSGGYGDNGYVKEWLVSSVASGGGGAIQNDLKFRYVAGGSATQYEALKLRHNGEVIVNEDGWGTHDFRVESDTNANLIFVDAGANSVGFGTNSTVGDSQNQTPVIGGYFTTRYGITAIPSTNTWTTVHTFANNAGNFMVSMRASGTGNTSHNSVGVAVIQANGATAFDYIRNGGTVQIRMSGLNLQVYQGVFAGANINWGVTNLGP
jgi:hypothetical protein